MSEQISFDRGKGFVALPVGILDIDLTPGAFRTLVELCRMANTDGFCWPSLTQLSERLGRSKSAISGYLKELRAVDLVTTEEQRTANGYNYRLKYKVTFWAEWRASLSQSSTEKRERRIQQAERPKENKNHSHKNHVQGDNLDYLLNSWSACFGKAPYPKADHQPAPELLRKTVVALDETKAEGAIISTDIRNQLDAFYAKLGLSPDDQASRSALNHLRALELSDDELTTVLTRVTQKWPSHWKKPPSEAQFERLVKETGVKPKAKKLALLKSNITRWRMAERSLRNRSASCSVSALTTPEQLAS